MSSPVQSMLLEWSAQSGARADEAGLIDGRTWRYSHRVETCGVCAQTIPVGRVSVELLKRDNAGIGLAHVKCVRWVHDRPCSPEHHAGHWHDKTDRALRLKGDLPSQPSPKGAATQLGKIDPVKAPRFTVKVATEHTPGHQGTKGYGKLLPLVDAVGAYVLRQDAARASGTPAPVERKPRKPAAPKRAPRVTADDRARAQEAARAARGVVDPWAMRQAWQGFARWMPAPARFEDRPVPSVASALASDPDLSPVELRAVLWTKVAEGSMSIDDAMAELEAVYALEVVR